MSEPAKTITREELYQRIWTTPIVRLGEELGFSYLEMVRICAALNVPRPSGGYWYRLAHNGVSEQVPLPPAAPGVATEIELGDRTRFEEQAEPEHEAPADDEQPTEASLHPRKKCEHRTVPALEQAREQQPAGQMNPSGEGKERVPEVAPGAQEGPATKSVAAPKPPPPGKVVYSRQQLYEAIWKTPCQALAKSLGVSDVALAKTCKKMGIPRPSLGYWARVAAGQIVPKMPLRPPLAGQDRILTFDVTANMVRREEEAKLYYSLRGLEDLAVELELPDPTKPLHPLAERHRAALEKLNVGDNGLVRLDRKELFQCEIAQTSIARLCRALHALIWELEARGYKFRASSEQYCHLSIIKGGDSVSIRCSEMQEQLEREPTEADKRKPSWTWQLKEVRATGRFSFEVSAWGLRGRRAWTETESRPLEEVLGILVEKVEGIFRGFEEKRKQEADEKKRREEVAKQLAEEQAEKVKRRAEEEKQQRERERLKQHEAKLQEIAEARRDNLVVAAQQWLDGQKTAAFIEACETHWRQAGGGAISKAQSEWLVWARTEAASLTPFGKGYPDPDKDGQFDRASIAVGGPYPETRVLEEDEPAAPDLASIKALLVEQARSLGMASWSPWGSKY